MTFENKTSRMFRMLLLLLNSYPRTQEECIHFLRIRKSAFYNYCNELKGFGFDVKQKEGKYWIEAPDKTTLVLASLLHFSEEEAYILARSIDAIDGNTRVRFRLKQKLVNFLNQEKALEAYLRKEKHEVVQILNNAIKNKKQVLLVKYSSGSSQTIQDRLVEPFEFNDDFNLVYAFDAGRRENRQFKICRMGDVQETPLDWKYAHQHRSMPVDVFRNSGPLNKQVEFEMNLRACNLLIEEYPLTEKYLTKTDGNRFRFSAPIAKYEGPGRFVLGMADDIRVVADDGFQNYLEEKILSRIQPCGWSDLNLTGFQNLSGLTTI